MVAQFDAVMVKLGLKKSQLAVKILAAQPSLEVDWNSKAMIKRLETGDGYGWELETVQRMQMVLEALNEM